MKRMFVIAIVLVVLVSACGPMYSVKKDKKGIYRTAELEYNILASDKADWGDAVAFNLVKYVFGSNTFFTAKVAYTYPNKGLSVNLLGINLGGGPKFGIKRKDGVLISVNGGAFTPLKYKTSPTYQVYTSRDGNGGSSQSHVETVECVLTPQWIPYLANAKSISVKILGTDEDPTKEKALNYYFKADNLKIIKRFYDEEVRNIK